MKENEKIKFTKTYVEVNLLEFYPMNPLEKLQSEQTGRASSAGITGAFQTAVISNVFTPGRIFIVKGMVTIQFIQLMRFINVDYPPNVNELFQPSLLESAFIQDFSIDENSEDGIMVSPYFQHKVSPYIINNCGAFLISGYVFLFAAVLYTLSHRKYILQINLYSKTNMPL